MKTIEFKENVYPAFQAEGFAAKFAIPFAQQVCHGNGYDIGCNRDEWKLPGAFAIDPVMGPFDAMNLPTGKVDYIFSSHCLEHLPKWTDALDYWAEHMDHGATMFLYLPDHSQSYWRPYHNRKHYHSFTPDIIKSYFTDQPNLWKNVFVSGIDLNNSFMVMAEKI